MIKFVKNTMLLYLPEKLEYEKNINTNRIYIFNKEKIQDGYIVYLIEREFRINYNFALNYIINLSKDLNLPLKVMFLLPNTEYQAKTNFIKSQLAEAKSLFNKINLKVEYLINKDKELEKHLQKIKIGLLVIDFNPLSNKNKFKNKNFKILEIDSHNIIPARYISDKQEYNAASFRRKVYKNIADFLKKQEIDYPINSEAEKTITCFLKTKLHQYYKNKNSPIDNVTSNLSKYLNLGFISSLEIAIRIIETNAEEINKESFLDELIIRKELAENFCLYASNFKSLNDIPNWAKVTIAKHQNDFREYIYNLKALEEAKTHDELWNAAQKQLIKTGTIQGYLRMYWAKKILEWSISHSRALEIAIYLNDKYAFDAPACNGYSNILWSIGGLHDRAFAEKNIYGKIRSMTYAGAKSKFNIQEYIRMFN